MHRPSTFLLLLAACAPEQPSAPGVGADLAPVVPSAPQAAWSDAVAGGMAASEFQPQPVAPGVLRLANRPWNLAARVDADGVVVGPRSAPDDAAAPVRLALVAVDGRALGAATPTVGACVEDGTLDAMGECVRRVERAWPGLTEWWTSAPQGLEQGFTVETLAPGQATLALDVDVSGGAADVREDAVLVHADDGSVLQVDGLAAWDARGRALGVRFVARYGGLRMEIGVEGALAPITVDPTITLGDTATVAQGYGMSVAAAGDVNNDGYGDLLVGAPLYDGGQTNEGAVFLYLGSATGLSTTAATRLESNQADAQFGYAVSNAGDLNGDGAGDIVVGAPYYDGGQANEGRVYVYFGTTTGSTGVSATPTTLEADQAEAHFGMAVGTVGDLDHNGLSELLVGAPDWDNGQADEGKVLTYLGAAGGVFTSPDWSWESNEAGARAGAAVGWAGDVNGDQRGDIFVAAPGHRVTTSGTTTAAGALYVFHADVSTVRPATAPSLTLEGARDTDLFARGVAGGADLDGDGYSDLAYSQGTSGSVRVRFGASTGLGAEVTACASYGAAIESLSVAGDLDGNGLLDIVAGLPTMTSGTMTNAGRVYGIRVTRARTFACADAYVDGDATARGLGRAVSAVDDDGDGIARVAAVGSGDGTTVAGRAAVADLATPVAVYARVGEFCSSSGTPGMYACESGSNGTLASVGDVNGDGYDDLAITTRDVNAGALMVWHGSATGLPVAVSTFHAIPSPPEATRDAEIASLGDANGDGYDDVMILRQDYDGASEAMVRVASFFAGSSGGLPSTATRTFVLDGTSIARAGDMNGDGYGDLLVLSGSVVRLHAGGPDGITATHASSATVNTSSTSVVSALGDVNGDGYGDVSVKHLGDTRVIFGSAAGIDPVVTLLTRPLGSTVRSGPYGVGDLDGDGFDDIVFADIAGGMYAWHGSAAGPVAQSALTCATTGTVVAVHESGDLNGDGYADVHVAAGTGVGTVQACLGGPTRNALTAYTAVAGVSAAGGGRMVGDYDGDGVADGRAHLGYRENDGTGRSFNDLTIRITQSSGLAQRPRTTYPSAGAGGQPRIGPGMAGTASDSVGTTLSLRGFGGRQRMSLEVELKPAGTRMDGTGVVASTSTTLVATAGSTVRLNPSGLSAGHGYDWHARRVSRASNGNPQRRGRWVHATTLTTLPAHVYTAGQGTTWYADADADGYGSADRYTRDRGGTIPSGYTATTGTDCDDTRASVRPGGTEVAGDGLDGNCDGAELCIADADQDGYVATTSPGTVASTDLDCTDPGEASLSTPTGDCGPTDATLRPGAAEEVCDVPRIDRNCDGELPALPGDADADGSDACEDCDDTDGSVSLAADEVAGDGVDNNCDGVHLCFIDADGDGARSLATTEGDAACAGSGFATATEPVDCDDHSAAIGAGADADGDGVGACAGDCDDDDATRAPGHTELVGDGVDQDCDGRERCYDDGDDDGARSSAERVSTDADCLDPHEALASDAVDCDDNDATRAPGIDGDGDGTNACTDCDDQDAARHPGATEVPGDGVDADCDALELCYRDADGDGKRSTATVASASLACVGDNLLWATPAWEVDCDDGDPDVRPGAPDAVGDAVDSNCDGQVTCFADLDEDGHVDADPAAFVVGLDGDCLDAHEGSLEGPNAKLADDCDDDDTRSYPGAVEVAGDGVDQDCDGDELCFDDLDGDGFRGPTTQEVAGLLCAAPLLDASAVQDCNDGAFDAAGAADADGDGAPACVDCDDGDTTRFPGAPETVGDEVDQDCDGVETCYVDADLDGARTSHATDRSVDESCAHAGLAAAGAPIDCDDVDENVYPGVPEVPGDTVDENCDGAVACFVDADGDGAGGLLVTSGTDMDCADSGEALEGGEDCDDTDPAVHPGAVEGLADGIDSDCDRRELCRLDVDDDGAYGTGQSPSDALDCEAPGFASIDAVDADCDDTDPSRAPGATENAGDGTDSDCDGLELCVEDRDGDGAGGAVVVVEDLGCTGYLVAGAPADCNDLNGDVRPGGIEHVGDSVDGDCDRREMCYADADGDGTRASATVESSDADCADRGEAGALALPDCDDSMASLAPDVDSDGDGADACVDCDDADARRSPYAGVDLPGDGVDADCDLVETCYADGDMDGYRTDEVRVGSAIDCSGDGEALAEVPAGDCDDRVAAVNPGALETCDGVVDLNCDGRVGRVDDDGDGFAACEECDDGDAAVNPQGIERCNGVDDDCDGGVDLEAVDALAWYADADSDGWADAAAEVFACAAPIGHLDADARGDCDDAALSVHPTASDVAGDGVDQDCDGADATSTGTGTGTGTPTDTGTGTDTSTPTDTGTGTNTGTPTDTGTGTDTSTPTDTGTGTDTGTPTDTGTGTNTGTPTDTGTGTDTGTPTDTGTGTDTGTPTDTGTVTATGSDTSSSTSTDGPDDEATGVDTKGCAGCATGGVGDASWLVLALAGVAMRRRRAA